MNKTESKHKNIQKEYLALAKLANTAWQTLLFVSESLVMDKSKREIHYPIGE